MVFTYLEKNLTTKKVSQVTHRKEITKGGLAGNSQAFRIFHTKLCKLGKTIYFRHRDNS